MSCLMATIGAGFALSAAWAPSSLAAVCPNEGFRGGASAGLPDCRAYELVTPADMGGLYPMERTLSSPVQYFPLLAISPDGGSVVFQTEGGVAPGFPGSGSDDRYRALRGASGWTSQLDGPTAAQSETPGPGGVSADHGYEFVITHASGLPDEGSLNQEAGVSPNQASTWTRYPDGGFQLVGEGELADDPQACGRFIAPGASHIIFATATCSGNGAGGPRLLPDAPQSGTQAIYDRTPAGLHTISLLPGDVTPTEEAHYQGVSADGGTVLFSLGGNIEINSGRKLYARVDDAETLEVAAGTESASVTPAGVSTDGRYVFYVQAGEIFAYDTLTATTATIAATGDAAPVNIAADGSHAYFVSESELGGEGTAGQPNLYLWTAASDSTSFVATVSPADVSGEPCLSCWTNGPASPRMDFVTGPGTDTSQATPDGGVLAFVSHAKLTGYENEEHPEVYRYEASTGSLTCVSCNPSGAPSGEARLQTFNPFLPVGPPYSYLEVGNLTSDGSEVFFETTEALARRDTDGVADVYEWRDGTASLISSGHSIRDNYLYGVTPSGSDVVFATNDVLLPRDHTGGSGSIYDARVGGGFAEPSAPACDADACQGQPTQPVTVAPPPSTTFSGKGNLRPRARCRARRHRAHGHRGRRSDHRAKRCRRPHRRAAR